MAIILFLCLPIVYRSMSGGIFFTERIKLGLFLKLWAVNL